MQRFAAAEAAYFGLLEEPVTDPIDHLEAQAPEGIPTCPECGAPPGAPCAPCCSSREVAI